MTEVPFPLMNKEDAQAVGVLATWYVADGETVAEDQVLADVQMDKVDAEVVAPTSGVVSLLVEEEAEVAQGSVIARIG